MSTNTNIYLHFENDPAKMRWSKTSAPTVEEQKRAARAWFGKLNRKAQASTLEGWEEEAASSRLSDKTMDVLEEQTALIDDLNFRSRETYEARRVTIQECLEGHKSEAEIDKVRAITGFSPEKLKQAVTTGTIKVGGAYLSNGKPLEGIAQETIDYLDQLIQQGKDEAKHRREQAAKNKAEKSRAEDFDLEATF